ncbi:hypothetical protein O7634_24640 [Micromonospora sp. WMMD1120]|uniref:hypothetical protein n=1 Tax=Micromonospora sp. WMMD1120 TaxID=3016106 RepID=UPI002415C325|nr:hypothetical protein [Micromonospora sp. WMMD1120]MDG4809952.1 hypothetical protein [Micromonospora sp. WMMD1120]
MTDQVPAPDEVERLEVGIDRGGKRVLRSSHRPEQQIIVGREAWTAFLASIRSGQDY